MDRAQTDGIHCSARDRCSLIRGIFARNKLEPHSKDDVMVSACGITSTDSSEFGSMDRRAIQSNHTAGRHMVVSPRPLSLVDGDGRRWPFSAPGAAFCRRRPFGDVSIYPCCIGQVGPAEEEIYPDRIRLVHRVPRSWIFSSLFEFGWLVE